MINYMSIQRVRLWQKPLKTGNVPWLGTLKFQCSPKFFGRIEIRWSTVDQFKHLSQPAANEGFL